VLRALSEPGVEGIENREHFVGILQAYGQSLLQPDINLFGQNLRSLEELNTKWKLYHKVIIIKNTVPVIAFYIYILSILYATTHVLVLTKLKPKQGSYCIS
jgi:hypothetical protein